MSRLFQWGERSGSTLNIVQMGIHSQGAERGDQWIENSVDGKLLKGEIKCRDLGKLT